MAIETKEAKRSKNADESATEKGTNGVMIAMVIATIIGVSSAMSFPNRQVETPASEVTEQSQQQQQSVVTQPSPLPAQAPNGDPAVAQSPIAPSPIAQSAPSPVAPPPAVRPSDLPSEPIYQNSQPLPAQP